MKSKKQETLVKNRRLDGYGVCLPISGLAWSLNSKRAALLRALYDAFATKRTIHKEKGLSSRI